MTARIVPSQEPPEGWQMPEMGLGVMRVLPTGHVSYSPPGETGTYCVECSTLADRYVWPCFCPCGQPREQDQIPTPQKDTEEASR